MEKRKNSHLLILVVSISAFVVLVFGVSFAFFAADMTNIGVTNVTVNIPQSSTMISTSATRCEINLNEASMSAHQQDVANSAAYSECDLNITLTGDRGIKCYYDLVLREETVANNENYVPYAPTSGIGVDYTFEFTGTITNTFSSNAGDNRLESISYYVDENTNISAIGNEIHMDTLADGLYIQNTETPSSGVIAKGVIGVDEQGVAAVHNYHFVEKWYNINKSQLSHAGKKYIYTLSAENILC